MRTTVGPLTLAALHHLLRHRLDVVPSRAVLIRIGEASGGNPLFALEVGRLLDEAGPRSAAEPLPVPADVNALVRRRTGRLPTATREVLLAAASLSDPREEIIRVALNRSIHADLEPAEREQIASLERGRVTFGHPLFAAYATSFNDATRALEHADAALALLEAVGDEVDPDVAASAASVRIRVGAVAGRGIDRALAERVLAHVSQAPPAAIQRSAAVLGGWFRWVDELETSRDLLMRELEEASRSGRETDRAGALIHLALTECLAGDLSLAREHAASALALADELEGAELTAMAEDALALVYATIGNGEELHALLSGATADRHRRAAAFGLFELSRGNYESADAYLRRALEAIEQPGIREPGIDRVHADAAEAAVAVRDLARAEGIAAFLELHGARAGHRWSLGTGAHAALARVYRKLGIRSRAELGARFAALQT